MEEEKREEEEREEVLELFLMVVAVWTSSVSLVMVLMVFLRAL